ncbi:acyl-CoA dehydratase activase-related protein [Athalassotoga saccharophila]|uniref:acyl-CoA dehydratase activase-related protein n=1 Tax=Athalassotoga saccharophila TaxID=1441386 RepID=UPI00137A1ACC|nr:acyl-CoA dehydratase activase-related protein [Athalassotoga saccharophila]BBJ27926.1 activator of (R)-2-hydroxyglutaryl-CoA dehydratase [Athalassotoga saccharophila]
MKIGIPRALYFYVYYPMWYGFFSSLGHEMKLSIPTNKEIINLGVSHSVDDICISVKVFHGHVKYLLNKDVDFVFVPRIASEEKYKYTCPKLAALPDLMKSAFVSDAGRILTATFYTRQGDKPIIEAFEEIGRQLGDPEEKVKRATKEGIKYQNLATKALRSGHTFLDIVKNIKNLEELIKRPVEKKRYTVALAGFPYDVYDTFTNGDVISKLEDSGVGIVTTDMLDPKVYKHYSKYMIKDLFWYQANAAAKGGMYYIDSPDIDGIISISSFNCGISSIYQKLLDLYSKEIGKPVMHIIVDEQTGDAGLATRIEAFIDLIRVKRGDGLVSQENNLHGTENGVHVRSV